MYLHDLQGSYQSVSGRRIQGVGGNSGRGLPEQEHHRKLFSLKHALCSGHFCPELLLVSGAISRGEIFMES